MTRAIGAPAPRDRPLLGRDAELGRLRAALPARGRPGGVAVVEGDAGIGKTRLVAELAHEARAVGSLVVTGHCVGAGGSSIAYLPFTELLAAVDAAVPEVVTQVIAAHPALAALLPSRGPVPAGTGGAGPVAEAVYACLSAAGHDTPLLGVVEDVHWADHSSRDLLTLLFTRGFDAPVTLITTLRSDDLHRGHPLHATLPVWARLPGLTDVVLAPLPADAMGHLIENLDGAPSDPTDVADLVVRAEGNPFFAEELVAAPHQLVAPDASAGLARLLRFRVDELDGEARDVVRAVAIGGRTVSHELLAHVTGLDDAALESAVAQAVDRHVLLASSTGYAVRHALLAETVVADLLPGVRTRLHRAYLHALREDPTLGPPAEVARHAAALGDTATAAAAALAAGDAALAVGGPRDALRHYESALGWLDGVPDRVDATLRAAAAAGMGGDTLRAHDLLQDALDGTPADDHPAERAELLITLAATSRALDLPDDPLELTDEAMSLVAGRRDALVARVMVARAQALVDARRPDEACDLTELAELLGTGHVPPALAAETRFVRAQVFQQRRDLDTAVDLLTELDGLAADDPLRIRACLRRGGVCEQQGRLAEALDWYEQGHAIALRLGQPWAVYALECRLGAGMIAYQLGRWDRADRLLESTRDTDAPQPGRALLDAARLLVTVGRGESVPLDALARLRHWWHVDTLLATYTLYPGIGVLTAAGQSDAAVAWVEEALAQCDRHWGTEAQAVVRLGALLASAAADAVPTLDGHVRARLLAAVDRLTVRARARLVRPVTDRTPAPGPETLAWGRRLEAELLRLAVARGEPVDPQSYVDRWSEAVQACEEYGHVPEKAYATTRLALALSAVGRVDDARGAAEQVRPVAEQLGMRPLLALLDGVGAPGGAGGRAAATPRSPGRRAAAATTDLTPREREVLDRLGLGRTNGEIAAELFISTKTASVHVSNILAKLGAATRGEAAAIARRRGLVG